jgi:hypothetical protein
MKKRFNTDSMTFLLPAESAATPAAVDYGNYYLVPLRQQASQTIASNRHVQFVF